MARPVSSDFISGHRFVVEVQGGDTRFRLQRPKADAGSKAGFQACSTPSSSTDVVEYREGTSVYTKKFPGIPSMDDVTLSRGVTRLDSTFFDWYRQVVEGSGDYRAMVTIKQMHRDNAIVGRDFTGIAASNLSNIETIKEDNPAREYVLFEAFPNTHKAAGDLDGTSADISIMELGVAYEFFNIIEHDA